MAADIELNTWELACCRTTKVEEVFGLALSAARLCVGCALR